MMAIATLVILIIAAIWGAWAGIVAASLLAMVWGLDLASDVAVSLALRRDAWRAAIAELTSEGNLPPSYHEHFLHYLVRA